MKSEDGDTVLVFNGEIYNNTELARRVARPGPEFSDPVRHRNGPARLPRVGYRVLLAPARHVRAGDLDESADRLVLARDRMGIKPLYICRRGLNLYFGSELKALFVHPEIERQINPLGLALLHFAQLRAVPAHDGGGHRETSARPLAGVARGPGSDSALLALAFPSRPHRYTLDSAAEELDSLLRRIRARASGLRRPAWRLGQRRVWIRPPFCTTPALTRPSRSRRSPSLSRAGVRRSELTRAALPNTTEPNTTSSISIPTWTSRAPSRTWHIIPTSPAPMPARCRSGSCRKMSREHVTVALSGEGADELFGGYNTYLGDRYAASSRHVPAVARRMALQLASTAARLRREDRFRLQAAAHAARIVPRPREMRICSGTDFFGSGEEAPASAQRPSSGRRAG